jgi:hypothetical protein
MGLLRDPREGVPAKVCKSRPPLRAGWSFTKKAGLQASLSPAFLVKDHGFAAGFTNFCGGRGTFFTPSIALYIFILAYSENAYPPNRHLTILHSFSL